MNQGRHNTRIVNQCDRRIEDLMAENAGLRNSFDDAVKHAVRHETQKLQQEVSNLRELNGNQSRMLASRREERNELQRTLDGYKISLCERNEEMDALLRQSGKEAEYAQQTYTTHIDAIRTLRAELRQAKAQRKPANEEALNRIRRTLTEARQEVGAHKENSKYYRGLWVAQRDKATKWYDLYQSSRVLISNMTANHHRDLNTLSDVRRVANRQASGSYFDQVRVIRDLVS